MVVSMFADLRNGIARHLALLFVFILGAVIRAVPEAIAGGYPVGWDTIAFYVPSTFYWAAGKAGLAAMIGEAPLIYLLSVPLYWVGVDPVWTFKLMGPLLYGLIIFSISVFLKNGLSWNKRASITGAIVASLYFITLRVGWDLYRTMAGLSFALLALSFLGELREGKKRLPIMLLVFLSVTSDQFTAVIIILLIAAVAMRELAHGNQTFSGNLAKVSIPGIAMLGLMTYAELSISGSLFLGQPPLGTPWNLMDTLTFLAYAYLPILPLAAFGLRSRGRFLMGLWSIICVGGAVVSSLPGLGLQPLSYRWVLLLTVPVCVFAASGLSRLLSVTEIVAGWVRTLGMNVPRVVIAILLMSAIAYMVLPSAHPFPYFTAYPAAIPTSLSQSTIPLSDANSVVSLLSWLKTNMSAGSVLISHQAIYGWALEYLPKGSAVINYGYATPMAGVTTAESRGYSSIMLIWWVDGSGWFGQSTVPSSFVSVQTNGEMALYMYL